jgi:hypothetical protein
MLKPNSKKTADHAEIEEMIAAFKQRGGVIEKLSAGVSSHLVKSRYVNRGRGIVPRLGEAS